jgi:hypothetical protein
MGEQQDSTDTGRTADETPARTGDVEGEQGTLTLGQPTAGENEELNARKWEARAKANAREAAKLTERLAKIEDQGKSDLQRAIERAEAAERARAEAELKSLRLDVATRKGLPPAMAARLRGDSEEELESDAEELLKLIAAKDAARSAPARDADQGKGNGSTGTTGDFNDWFRRAAGTRPAP